MISHAPAISLASDRSGLPNQPFFAWLRTQTTLFISQIAAILGFVYFLASLIYYVLGAKKETGETGLFDLPTINVLIDYAHVGLIVVFILVLIQVLDDNARGSYRVSLVYKRVFKGRLTLPENESRLNARLEMSKDQLKKLKLCFLCFWCAMLALYIAFSIEHSFRLVTSSAAGPMVMQKVARDDTASLYPIGKDEGWAREELRGSDVEYIDSAREKYFPFITFALNNTSLLFVFWCFVILYAPPYHPKKLPTTNKLVQAWQRAAYLSRGLYKQEGKLRNRRVLLTVGSTVLIVVFTASFPIFIGRADSLSRLRDYRAVFDALSGTLNALVLALLIARLDSKLIGLPSWLICVLYSYSAVQPLFVVFQQDTPVFHTIETAVLIVVFISKIYFFLIIIYTLQTGRMLNYLFCFPVLRRRVGIVRRQLEFDQTKRERAICRASRLGIAGGLKKLLRATSRRDSFWMRSPTTLLVSKTLGTVTLVLFFGYLIYFAVHSEHGAANWARLIIVRIHLVVLGGIILALIFVLGNNSQGTKDIRKTFEGLFDRSIPDRKNRLETSKDQLQSFKRYFLSFWCATFLLYIVFLLKPDKSATPEEVALITHGDVWGKVWYPFLTFSLSNLNLLCAFWCFVVLYLPAFDEESERKQKLLIRYSLFVVLMLIIGFPLLLLSLGHTGFTPMTLSAYSTVFLGISGTLSAVVLALLVARLDSKLISLSSWVISVLFAYSAVQSLLVVFEQRTDVFEAIENSVLMAALTFKVCFFLIISHVLQTGTLRNYMVCFPFLNKRVDSIFENQFEIKTSHEKAEPFTFSIWKKNRLVYSSSVASGSRWDCDWTIKNLRERMKTQWPYRYREECGTHWVEITDSTGSVICESMPLRSRDEAKQLIEESIDKIPYCKYNRT